MHSLKKITLLFPGITMSLFLSVCCFAQSQENVEITTYYPSPVGVYQTMRLYPNDAAVLGSACTDEGEMFYHTTDKQIYLCNGATWQPLSGYWTLTGNYLYPSGLNWNLGIGNNTSYGSSLAIQHSGTDAVIIAGSGVAGETATFGWSSSNFTYIQGGTWATAPRSLVLQAGGGSVGINTTNPDTSYKLDVNGKFKAKNIYARQVSFECSPTSTICNTIGPAVSGNITVSFPTGTFSTIPYVTCSAGPWVSMDTDPGCTCDRCDYPGSGCCSDGCDAHSCMTCTIVSVNQNNVTVKVGTNRYAAYMGNHFTESTKFVNIIAIEP
ncbi:MAG: hypothetical protein PHQ96_03915 [Candidatus Omnitrophica bacterium]|nr:hypothetical protein [Candidatus Omnitrophota bacterium]